MKTRCWVGFGKIKKEIAHERLIYPFSENGTELNDLLEHSGIRSRWVEHRLFVGGNLFFATKAIEYINLK